MERERKEKMDAFWDIGQLVPPQKKKDKMPYEKKAVFANVFVEDKNRTKTIDEKNTLHFGSKPAESLQRREASIQCYENFSPLIKRVEIHPWKSSYHYYEFFCKNAQTYYKIRGKECARVPFFSYVAQYSQMNKEQLNWYFWWRENVRKSVFFDTDLSYIYLYIYEIINLGDLIDTQKALNSLIEIWYHYRNIYPQLNNALGEWICDYSLLNRLPIPFPHPLISREMLSACSFREPFYFFDVQNKKNVAFFLLSFCSGYDYRKSKFYAENQSLYDELLPNCLSHLIPFLTFWKEDDEKKCKHISKVAFVGALCSYRIRKHIEVDHIPSCSGDFKLLMTNVIKYSENMLRSYLGIRSRLGCHTLPENLKAEIDSFFADRFPGRIEISEQKPEYEKLYEGKNEEFSLQKALEMEQSAWNITRELVEAFEDNDSLETFFDGSDDQKATGIHANTTEKTLVGEECKPQKQEVSDQDPVGVFLNEISEYRGFFDAIVSRDTIQQRAFCRTKGIFHESAADFINEKAVDVLGDILLEEIEGGYILIEDYRELFVTEE